MELKRLAVIAGVMAVMVFANYSYGGVSLVVNGSFENDGWGSNQDITEQPPDRWEDVNVPAGKFDGYVEDGWSLHGYYSLTLRSDGYGTFEAGDIVTVSQKDIYLDDVNHIMFRLKLRTDWSGSGIQWDPNNFSAVLQIDGNDVWDSNSLASDGDYEGPVDINESSFGMYKDSNSHKLTLAVRANQTQPSASYIYHMASFDFVRFDTHADCNGFDYPAGDFTYDAFVDEADLGLFAANWLTDTPRYDLHSDGIVDFYDLAIFAQCWKRLDCGEDALLEMDLNNDGIVDFYDFALVADGWQAGEYDDISALASQWLLKSWLYGL